MDVFRPISSDSSLNATALDPRLQPTPDYGTLGPGSDVGRGASSPANRYNASAVRSLFAIGIGILVAVLVGSIAKARAPRPHPTNYSSSRDSAPASVQDPSQLDRLKPQKQAETLLELAVGHSRGAVEQISSRVDGWHGKVRWNSQIATLTTAALNSSDMRVRESGIEVELAAYGLAKNPASFEYLEKEVNSADHAQKIWALWALGLMGNRGVETGRATEILTAHLKDPDVDSRRWAVEAVALVGTAETIPVLLQAMHDDPSPLVRERAACSLAESGMLSPEQRAGVVPQLISYSDDPALDAQTHAWAFEALADITHQRLPSDSAAWRKWYESSKPQ